MMMEWLSGTVVTVLIYAETEGPVPSRSNLLAAGSASPWPGKHDTTLRPTHVPRSSPDTRPPSSRALLRSVVKRDALVAVKARKNQISLARSPEHSTHDCSKNKNTARMH
jgi:hypothetical protein